MMNSITNELMTTAKTFRFASGQILTLDDDQIEKIPYLTALVSAADYFESVHDEEGHYKLDPHIDYNDFLFVLKSISFHSVRQLFTHLSEEKNVIPIIDLIDFLGLGPQPDPTLNEVDSIFFSTIVYSPFSRQHLQIIKPRVMQDMAVRFAIAMAKEEYNFSNNKVVDQIYWFIMFILSAHEYFGPRLRYHVYSIAKHCFTLFKPSLLKALGKLILGARQNIKMTTLNTDDIDVEPDEEITRTLEQRVTQIDLDPFYEYFCQRYNPLKRREDLLLYRTSREYDWIWDFSMYDEKDDLKTIYERVLEIMYERLQSEICQRARMKMCRKTNPKNFLTNIPNLDLDWDFVESMPLPKTVEDLFQSEFVQAEIREHILQDLYILTPTLKQRHVELINDIQEYQQILEGQNQTENYYSRLLFIRLRSFSQFERMQEEALSYELILDKIQRNSSSVVEQIQQRVLDGLYATALDQFKQWTRTQNNVNQLYYQPSSCQRQEKFPSKTSKHAHQQRQISVKKPLPKRPMKYKSHR